MPAVDPKKPNAKVAMKPADSTADRTDPKLPGGPTSTDVRKGQRKQEVFLPIHGHVGLYCEELAIVDHPSFQRLRRVRQLGMAHMVFPGATHTRFEHCVGAVHVAQLIVDHANENCLNTEDEGKRWRMTSISEPMARFIRLAGC